MKDKEIIRVSDLATNVKYPDDNDLSIDDWDTCKCIYQENISFDGEKGFVDIEVVVQRLSDNKFFKFTYTDYGRGESSLLEETAYEVEEKEKVIKYYE